MNNIQVRHLVQPVGTTLANWHIKGTLHKHLPCFPVIVVLAFTPKAFGKQQRQNTGRGAFRSVSGLSKHAHTIWSLKNCKGQGTEKQIRPTNTLSSWCVSCKYIKQCFTYFKKGVTKKMAQLNNNSTHTKKKRKKETFCSSWLTHSLICQSDICDVLAPTRWHQRRCYQVAKSNRSIVLAEKKSFGMFGAVSARDCIALETE